VTRVDSCLYLQVRAANLSGECKYFIEFMQSLSLKWKAGAKVKNTPLIASLVNGSALAKWWRVVATLVQLRSRYRNVQGGAPSSRSRAIPTIQKRSSRKHLTKFLKRAIEILRLSQCRRSFFISYYACDQGYRFEATRKSFIASPIVIYAVVKTCPRRIFNAWNVMAGPTKYLEMTFVTRCTGSITNLYCSQAARQQLLAHRFP
jgi:hypothetical protein